MIPISEEGKKAFLDRGNIVVYLEFEDGTVLSNPDFVIGTFQLEQTLCEEEQLVYGSIGSACLSVNILKTAKSYKGLRFSLYTSASDEDRTYKIKLGEFTVTEDSLGDNRRYRSLKAYDDIYLTCDKDVSMWYNDLHFPMTVLEFRNSLFDYVGLAQEEEVLINDGITLERTVDIAETTLTFKTVASAICELNGALGCINYKNEFRYVTPDIFNDALFPSDDLFPADDLYPKDYYKYGLFPRDNLYPSEDIYPSEPTIMSTLNITGENSIIRQGSYVYKDYYVRPIDKVVIKESDEDYGTIYGEGTNAYEVIGNFLTFANEQLPEMANRLYYILHKVVYIPTKFTAIGMPWIELGDYVKVIGNAGGSIFPLLHRKLSGVSAMIDEYESDGTEYSATQVTGVNASMRQLKSRTLKLKTAIDEVSSELTEYEEKTDGTLAQHRSLIKQLPHTISLEVEGELDQTNRKASIQITLLDEDGKEIDSADGDIVLSGNVIFKSNLSDGVTVISGNNIKTGTILADYVKGGTFEVGGTALAKDGELRVKDSSGRTIILLNKYGMTLYDENGNGKAYLDHTGVTVSGGTINGAVINAGGTMNGAINIYDSKGNRVGHWDKDGFDVSNNIIFNTPKFRVDSAGSIYGHGDLTMDGGGGITGRFSVGALEATDVAVFNELYCYNGDKKHAVMETKNYGYKVLSAYETPTAYFGDIGEGKTDDFGECVIAIDDILRECINTDCMYQVFLQAYGEGQVYVAERTQNYFIVKGTPNLKFGWEFKALQRDNDGIRFKELDTETLDILERRKD